jgi:hypothetical protein
MNKATYSKEAGAILTYDFDWSDWLGTRTLSTSTWDVPAGITNDDDTNTTTRTFITLSGGTWGESYEIVNHIVASDGSEQSQSFTIKIQYDVHYVTRAEVRASAQSMTEKATPPATDDLVDALIERVSRLFDRECGVSDGYFNEPLYPDPTARTFYGNGLNCLKLDPYVPGTLSTTLSFPDGYTTPRFIEVDGHLEVVSSSGVRAPGLIYSSGWYSGVPIAITAQWGFAETPADVKSAIIEWVINVWRETDPAGLKLVGLDGQVLREAIPPRVKEIAKFYRMNSAKAVFV